jgi:hypothetical protein
MKQEELYRIYETYTIAVQLLKKQENGYYEAIKR